MPSWVEPELATLTHERFSSPTWIFERKRGVDQIIRAIPGATMASVSVLRGDTAETVAATNDLVVAVDADQYAAGEGPCLEAARTGQFVRNQAP